MAKRKTIEVREILELANRGLALRHNQLTPVLRDCTPEQAYRMGLASLLTQILSRTGYYNGFGYTNETGDADETKRHYYVDSSL